MKRSSGLDFSDRGGPALDMHPDIVLSAGNPNLQRNKTERNRLQGLMRSTTLTGPPAATDTKAMSWKEKWDLWMINEGGRRLFFFTWVFLHLLVFAFGWVHYDLKDNLVTARSIFGVTFGEYWHILSAFVILAWKEERGGLFRYAVGGRVGNHLVKFLFDNSGSRLECFSVVLRSMRFMKQL